MNYIYEYNSPVGLLTISSDGESITGLWIKGQKYFAATLDEKRTAKDLPVFESAREWLDDYFNGKKPDCNALKLNPKGSAFRQSVWDVLCDVPYGEVVTYKDIAQQINCKSAQAVGGAVGHNPISIIIPCHRVVGSDGSLTGYAGGIDKKKFLLNLEHAAIASGKTIY